MKHNLVFFLTLRQIDNLKLKLPFEYLWKLVVRNFPNFLFLSFKASLLHKQLNKLHNQNHKQLIAICADPINVSFKLASNKHWTVY